jgi:hypothetical protein
MVESNADLHLHLQWQKAKASSVNGTCVEVAALPNGGGVAVRDSKDPQGPILSFTSAEWASFCDGMAGGEFAHLTHQ